MSRPPKNILSLSKAEETELESISRSHTAEAVMVARAKALLAVHKGFSYEEAAIQSGRRSSQAVSNLIARFKERGIEAVHSLHGGGAPKKYSSEERQHVLECVSHKPNTEEEGTNTWSIGLLQEHLERNGKGHLSRDTVWHILHEGGYRFQKGRTWIRTGKVMRKREGKLVEVEDPEKEAKKKSNSRGLRAWG